MEPSKDLAAPALKDSRLHLAEPPQVSGGERIAEVEGRGYEGAGGGAPPPRPAIAGKYRVAPPTPPPVHLLRASSGLDPCRDSGANAVRGVVDRHEVTKRETGGKFIDRVAAKVLWKRRKG